MHGSSSKCHPKPRRARPFETFCDMRRSEEGGDRFTDVRGCPGLVEEALSEVQHPRCCKKCCIRLHGVACKRLGSSPALAGVGMIAMIFATRVGTAGGISFLLLKSLWQ